MTKIVSNEPQVHISIPPITTTYDDISYKYIWVAYFLYSMDDDCHKLLDLWWVTHQLAPSNIYDHYS